MDITESESTNKPVKVFISYSHETESWKRHACTRTPRSVK